MITQILNKHSESLAEQLRQKLPKATGKTASQITAQVNGEVLQILGPSHLFTLESGRGPSKSATPSNPTLFQAIKEWALAKGVINNATDREALSVVARITQSIHKKGTRKYREGQQGTLSQLLQQLDASALFNELSAAAFHDWRAQVINQLKQLN